MPDYMPPDNFSEPLLERISQHLPDGTSSMALEGEDREVGTSYFSPVQQIRQVTFAPETDLNRNEFHINGFTPAPTGNVNTRRSLRRQQSIYNGSDSSFKEALRETSTALSHSESLDYDNVDNRVFREFGRHHSAVGASIVTLFIGE